MEKKEFSTGHVGDWRFFENVSTSNLDNLNGMREKEISRKEKVEVRRNATKLSRSCLVNLKIFFSSKLWFNIAILFPKQVKMFHRYSINSVRGEYPSFAWTDMKLYKFHLLNQAFVSMFQHLNLLGLSMWTFKLWLMTRAVPER